MQSVDTTLGVFEIGSIALGYQALASATRSAAVKVLEATPIRSSRFLILVEGTGADVKRAHSEVRRLCETFSADLLCDVELIEGPEANLLPALYSLAQVEMKESLLVVETDSVAGLLAVSQALLKRGLEVIELKGVRGAFGRGLGFFTGPLSMTGPAAEEVRTRLKQAVREGRVEVIDQAVPGFRQFFNLTGL